MFVAYIVALLVMQRKNQHSKSGFPFSGKVKESERYVIIKPTITRKQSLRSYEPEKFKEIRFKEGVMHDVKENF